jgi:hypothetical protein
MISKQAVMQITNRLVCFLFFVALLLISGATAYPVILVFEGFSRANMFMNELLLPFNKNRTNTNNF